MPRLSMRSLSPRPPTARLWQANAEAVEAGERPSPKPADKDLKALFEMTDADRSGRVGLSEFVELYAKVEPAAKKRRGSGV